MTSDPPRRPPLSTSHHPLPTTPEEATSPLVTTDHLDRRFAEHRAELYRALWIQGAGIVTINAAIIAAAGLVVSD